MPAPVVRPKLVFTKSRLRMTRLSFIYLFVDLQWYAWSVHADGRVSNHGYRNSCFLHGLQIRLGKVLVCDHVLHGAGRHNVAQAAPAELARIAYCHSLARNFDHRTIHLRFEKIGGEKPGLDIEAIHP